MTPRDKEDSLRAKRDRLRGKRGHMKKRTSAVSL